MSKENSQENISGLGRVTSRSNFSFVSNSIDDVLDKLKFLNYHAEFCIPNNLNPIHRFYFLYPNTATPTDQFYVFSMLFGWLLLKLGVAFEKPGQFDDQNAISANMIFELKKLGIPFEFGPAKLKQGYGDGCIFVLQSLTDQVMEKVPGFKKPIHSMDEYVMVN
jgi:estrogen-related receptor beta like 1